MSCGAAPRYISKMGWYSSRFRGAGEIDALARRMERWFRFAFNDFLPGTASVAAWRSPECGAILRAWGAAPCPECGHYMLPRVGAIGVALDEAAPLD